MDSNRAVVAFLLAMRGLYGLSVVLVALSGCASSSRRQASGAPEQRDAAGLAQALETAAKARTEYRIAPDDLLDVAVYQDRNLSVKAHVDADGQITLPLAGTVHVAGQSESQAQALVAEQLSKYVKNPQVSVTVESRAIRQLFVLGEVQKPGPYAIPSGTTVTVLQAVTDAGGFTKMAAPKRAHVLRYVDGKSMDYKIDIKALIRRGDRENDMVLQPNDVVYVPESLF